jgi:hypothetical protein
MTVSHANVWIMLLLQGKMFKKNIIMLDNHICMGYDCNKSQDRAAQNSAADIRE